MNKRVKFFIAGFLVAIFILLISYFSYQIISEEKYLFYAPEDHSVTRSFDKNLILPNNYITVTLTVDVFDGNDNVYTIEERIPSGVNIINPGDGTISGNKIKWVVYNQDGTPVVDATHTYVVSSSSIGTYTITGKAAFNSEKPAQNILGDSQFNVVGCIPEPEVCDGIDNNCDGIPDNGLEPDDCQGTCTIGGYTWTNNGGTLNCCGDDANEDSPYQPSESSPIDLCSDGQDNDCDGEIDLADSDCYVCVAGVDTQPCTKQDGVCLGSQETCNAQGQWDGCNDAIYLAHNSNYESDEATCDNIDNDCDAETDETPDLLCSHLGEYTCRSGNCECNSLYEEDTSLFIGNCNGCVSPQELSYYIYEWKVMDNDEITQEELTSAINNYLTGVSGC